MAGCGGSLLHTGALDVNALVGYVCMGVRKSVVDGRGVVLVAVLVRCQFREHSVVLDRTPVRSEIPCQDGICPF